MANFEDSSYYKRMYNCQYCGQYIANFDSTYKNDVTHIYVQFNLLKDSTYSYSVGGIFSWCTLLTIKGAGKWFAKDDLLYFRPDTIIDGYGELPEAFFAMGDSENKWSHILKAPMETDKCPKIYFRFMLDCFDSSWGNKFVQKIGCK